MIARKATSVTTSVVRSPFLLLICLEKERSTVIIFQHPEPSSRLITILSTIQPETIFNYRPLPYHKSQNARSRLDKHPSRTSLARRPLSQIQQLPSFPFFQYLQDEKAKGNKINGREKHLLHGRGGELWKWVEQEAEHSVFCYPERSMRPTYYPEYVDEVSPLSSPESYEQPPERRSPDPILPFLEEFCRQNQLR